MSAKPNFFQLDSTPARELVPGFVAKLIHTDGLTVAHVRAVAGSRLPEHQHIHEQVTNVLEGELEMTLNGHTRHFGPGSVICIPSDVPHSARALTDCYLIDVFRPVREDYQ